MAATGHGRRIVLGGAALGLAAALVPAHAQGTGDAARGHAYVDANCARCHATEATGESPLKGAPPFRTLHERYPVEDLAEGLAEGIVTGHPDMPQFELSPDQIDDLIAYLKSLEG